MRVGNWLTPEQAKDLLLARPMKTPGRENGTCPARATGRLRPAAVGVSLTQPGTGTWNHPAIVAHLDLVDDEAKLLALADEISGHKR